MQESRFTIIKLSLISLVLLLFGHLFIVQRQPDAPIGPLGLSGDALHYVCMVEGDFTCADTPFRFRVLVPLLAKLLPLSAAESLRLITYASLFTTYFLVLLICRKLGMSTQASLVGLLVVYTSNVHVNNYRNPFLLDPFQQMTLTALLFALMYAVFWLYAAAVVLGVLTREAPFVAAPAWALTRHWRSGILVVVVAAVALMVPRLVVPHLPSENLVESFTRRFIAVNSVRNPLLVPGYLFWSWGFIWLMALLGLCLLPKSKFVYVATLFGLLSFMILASMLFAEDTAREVAVLTPIFAVSCAQLFARLRHGGHTGWALGMAALAVTQVFVALPNWVFGEDVWGVVRWLKVPLLVVGCAYSLAVGWLLRPSLIQDLREKCGFLVDFARDRLQLYSQGA